MKMRIEGQSNDMMTASANFRHFMNRLNHTILKSAAKRHGRRLKVFCVRESHAEGYRKAKLELRQINRAMSSRKRMPSNISPILSNSNPN